MLKRPSIKILSVLLAIFVIMPSSYASANPWSNTINDSMSYLFPGAGWGSVTYNFSNFEDYSYNRTYKVGTSSKRQVAYKPNYGCPYTCEIRFTNFYLDSLDGSQITGITNYSYSAGSYWPIYQEPGTLNYRNSQSISSSINSQLNLRTRIGLYVNNSGWVFLGSKDYYGNIR